MAVLVGGGAIALAASAKPSLQKLAQCIVPGFLCTALAGMLTGAVAAVFTSGDAGMMKGLAAFITLIIPLLTVAAIIGLIAVPLTRFPWWAKAVHGAVLLAALVLGIGFTGIEGAYYLERTAVQELLGDPANSAMLDIGTTTARPDGSMKASTNDAKAPYASARAEDIAAGRVMLVSIQEVRSTERLKSAALYLDGKERFSYDGLDKKYTEGRGTMLGGFGFSGLPEDLGPGLHELRLTAETVTGKVITARAWLRVR